MKSIQSTLITVFVIGGIVSGVLVPIAKFAGNILSFTLQGAGMNNSQNQQSYTLPGNQPTALPPGSVQPVQPQTQPANPYQRNYSF